MNSAGLRNVLLFGLALLGGGIFAFFSLPLPWMLGPMAAIVIWQFVQFRFAPFLPEPANLPKPIYNAALIVIGCLFGLRFTSDTLQQVQPYFLPFIAMAMFIIVACAGFGFGFSKWSGTDMLSSIFGFVPGGITEMTVTGEELGAKPAVIVFIHILRLLTVLSIIPFSLTAIYGTSGNDAFTLPAAPPVPEQWLTGIGMYGWFFIPVFLSWLLRRYVPASYVIVTMIGTALLQIGGVALPSIPTLLVIASQIMIGIGIGQSVAIRELHAMGKQFWRVTAFMAGLLLLSFFSALALNRLTGMDLPTAILSTAPGGVVEMGLVAASVGADPVLVIALQMTRLYLIVIAVPLILKKAFAANKNRTASDFSRSS